MGPVASCLVLLLAAAGAATAAPHLAMEAGLVLEAGVRFVADPTGITLRLQAESTRRLTGLTILVNDRDLTDRIVRSARVGLAPDGRSASLVLDRLPLLPTGLPPAAEIRIEVTVRDEAGATALAALLRPSPPRLPFTTLAQGSFGGIRSRERVVVRDADAWEAFWRRHAATVRPDPPAPAVDFASRTLLAVTQGERPTGGYEVRVTEVRSAADPGGELVVLVEENAPAPGTAVITALTSPFHFVTIPRWDGPVRFQVLEEPAR
jgi:hypothetical protein